MAFVNLIIPQEHQAGSHKINISHYISLINFLWKKYEFSCIFPWATLSGAIMDAAEYRICHQVLAGLMYSGRSQALI